MKTLVLLAFLFTSFFVRALRWLGILQQKEYRFDRIILFLSSSEGLKELLRIFPKKSDFSKTGLKRPKVTQRSFLMGLTFILVSIFYINTSVAFGKGFLIQWYPYPLWYNFLLFIVVLFIYLVLIPFFVMLSAVPTVLLAYVKTYKRLYQAKKVLSAKKPIIVGITGSYGKTSTKILLNHVLGKQYSVFKTPKSFNTKYSVAESVVSGYKGEQIALIEYAAYKKGEIRELAKWIQPNMAIITGLTKQHVGLFGSLEEIISAKAELVASLPKKAVVICNVYDQKTQEIYETGKVENKAELVAVSPDLGKAKLSDVKIDSEGKLQFKWGENTVKTQLIGAQYIEVVHLVIVTALHFEMKKEQIIEALESFNPHEKFILSYKLVSGAKVIDDGDTSNPKGFSAIITLGKSYKANRKILVTPGIVDLGDDSKQIHSDLAVQSQKVFDSVVYVGESGIEEFKSVFGDELLTSEEQLREVVSTLNETDLVIIEGRMPAWALKYLR